MTNKRITLKFVVPTAVAIALGIVYGGVYLRRHFSPVDQTEANRSVAGSSRIAELPDARLSRVHLLLSNMK